eukprot:CAMPEP_0196770038 /NCGR_PEP_ID=MMETSP1104-20130614/892_1 /TAXON_ID=33652 /ORGANISM="Cafeteria sp., Strain Caron Lab Isolate" /LENGTH=295 /DNA_ID=CAMNT_0042140143 /DNA_START=77 /DNA_END=962 /DNA_ORIENTATION=+
MAPPHTPTAPPQAPLDAAVRASPLLARHGPQLSRRLLAPVRRQQRVLRAAALDLEDGGDDGEDDGGAAVGDEHEQQHQEVDARVARVEVAQQQRRQVADEGAEEEVGGDGEPVHLGRQRVLQDGDGGSEPGLGKQVFEEEAGDGEVEVAEEHGADERGEAQGGADGGHERLGGWVVLGEPVAEPAAHVGGHGASHGDDECVQHRVLLVLVGEAPLVVDGQVRANRIPAEETQTGAQEHEQHQRLHHEPERLRQRQTLLGTALRALAAGQRPAQSCLLVLALALPLGCGRAHTLRI